MTDRAPTEREPRTPPPEARTALSEILGDSDHSEFCCGQPGEADCIIEGLSDRGFVIRAAASPSTGTTATHARRLAVEPDGLPLDVRRLAEAIHARECQDGSDHAIALHASDFLATKYRGKARVMVEVLAEYARLGPSEDKT